MSENQNLENTFTTMGEKKKTRGHFEWLNQFPKRRFPTEPDEEYELVNREKLIQYLQGQNISEEAMQRVMDDLNHLDQELLTMFRERDHEAKRAQNLYRMYQLGFMGLAAIATAIGSFQVIALDSNPNLIPIIAFFQTVVALFTTYLATLRGNKPPLPEWLENRRTAEYLRREYFRYLTDAPPYANRVGRYRRQLLSLRAAKINRNMYPDDDDGGQNG